MTVRALLLSLGVLALLTGATPAVGQESSLYDPVTDVVGPNAARWLYVGSMLYEAPLWGVSLSGGLGMTGRKATAVQLLADPAAFFGALWGTRHRQMTLGMVWTSATGAVHGYCAGFAAGDLLLDWGQTMSNFNPRLVTAVAGSVAGNIVGLRHADAQELNVGNAYMLAQAGMYGALYSGYVMALPLPFGNNGFGETGVPWRRKLVEAAGLAGWGAGLYYWNRLGPRNYTTGDALSISNSNSMAALTAVAVASLLPEKAWNWEWSWKGSSLLPALVNAGGIWYGYDFHRNRDVTFGQGLLVSIGTTLGAACIGTAVTMLATTDYSWPDPRLMLCSAAAGGWLGYHLTHGLLDTSHPGQGLFGWREPGLRLTLMPANALGVLMAAKTGTAYRAPLICAEF